MITYPSASLKRLVLPLDDVIGCASMYELGEFGYGKAIWICLFWLLYKVLGALRGHRYVGCGVIRVE